MSGAWLLFVVLLEPDDGAYLRFRNIGLKVNKELLDWTIFS